MSICKAQGYGTCPKRNSKLSKKIVAVIHKMLLPLLVISSLYFFSLSLTPSTLCNWRLIRVALCQWQQGCHPPVSKSLLLSPSQATADQGHICSKQRTSKGRDMGRGRDSEQQQRDTDRQTDAETRIETKTERNKEGGGQLYWRRKEGGCKMERKGPLDRGRWKRCRKQRDMGKENLCCVVLVVNGACGFHTGRGRMLSWWKKQCN